MNLSTKPHLAAGLESSSDRSRQARAGHQQRPSTVADQAQFVRPHGWLSQPVGPAQGAGLPMAGAVDKGQADTGIDPPRAAAHTAVIAFPVGFTHTNTFDVPWRD